jgi:hypothetical protein
MPLPTTCLRCGAELQRGAIAGQLVYLNWIPEGESVGWTTMGKKHMATGALLRPPMLPAAVCTSCGLGVFEQ